MSEPYAIDLEDVRRAAETIAGQCCARRLSRRRGCPSSPARRCASSTRTCSRPASFKERGAVNKLASLTPEERGRGVVAMSAGNHAQAVAYHAKRLGIPATIVMPVGTPLVKVENTRAHGAGSSCTARRSPRPATGRMRTGARARGSTLRPPLRRSAGHGRPGHHRARDARRRAGARQIVVPIGGGGLISGIAVAAKALNPTIEIIGVEAALYPSFYNAHPRRATGRSAGRTLAEGIAVKTVGR